MIRLGKRGSGAGDIIEMIPVLAIISIVAVVVFGISATYYSYDISVRDAEARLLNRDIVECLSLDGVFNLDNIAEDDYSNVISYCGLKDSDRFYVGVEVFDNEGKKIKSLSEGDSGKLWVRDLFKTGNAILGGNEDVKRIVNYNPGYFDFEYLSFVVLDGKRIKGKIKVEALVNYEE